MSGPGAESPIPRHGDAGVHPIRRTGASELTFQPAGGTASEPRLPRARGPRVSVLIGALRRREFLPLAVESVLRQTLPRASYQVVVVKDFPGNGFDDRLRREGVTVVHRESESMGALMQAGVEACEGEVVSFLDDDDTFDPEKLRRVRDAFAGEPDLGYYHNGLALIDERGAAIGSPRPAPGDRAYVLSANWGFCTSCISIRRDLLVPVLERWPEVPRSVDSFLDFVSRASSCLRLATMEPLTRYRLHPGSNSRRTNHASSYYSTARILRSLPRNRSRNGAITALLGRYMSAALRGRSHDRRSALEALAWLAAGCVLNELRPDAREVLCGAVMVVSPTLSQRLYSAMRHGNVDWLPPA